MSNDVDVSGLERGLVRAGRYLGQRELAHLVHDWAVTAKAPGIVAIDETWVSLRGNSAMAEQLHDVVRRGHRMHAEVKELVHSLRDERDLTLVLDQEDARTSGGTLLTATHPLVLAAVLVPGHRQARFANVRVQDPESVVRPGRYAVVLALIEGTGDRATREIWGAALTSTAARRPRRCPTRCSRRWLAGRCCPPRVPPTRTSSQDRSDSQRTGSSTAT